jgi:hypothetical protein
MNEEAVTFVEELPEGEIIVEEKKVPTPEELDNMLKEIKRQNIISSSRIFKGGIKFGGSSKVGVTRKVKKLSKAVSKKTKDARKKTRKILNKKFRPSGSKKPS